MALTKLQVEQPEKVKPTLEKPVEGYLKKARSFSFEGDNGGEVTLLEVRLRDKVTGKLKRCYLSGSLVDLENDLKAGFFTQISKRAVKDTESGLEFEVTDVAQDDQDVLKG